jgi:phosphoglycerate dehydrogenase-like enzyme
MLPPQRELTLEWASRLRSDVPGVTVLTPNDEGEAARMLGQADAAFGVLSPGLLPHASTVRWLQAPAAGPTAGFFYPELVAHPAVVTNLRGIHRDVVSTHAVALLLALCRDLPRYQAQQSRREWLLNTDPSSCLHLPDATVLIVGLGEIGSTIAQQLAPFGSRILATDARRTEPPAGVHELYREDELAAVLPLADAVVVTVPHTPQTDRLFDRAHFDRMKSSALLVNVGRGAVVDIDELAVALAEGRLGGAGLDVFPEEPLPEDHALWGLPRVIITPHSATSGVDVDDRIYEIIRMNAVRFSAGEPLMNLVDKARWF